MSFSNTAQNFGGKFELDLLDNQDRPLDSYLSLVNVLARLESEDAKGAFLVKAKMNNPFQAKAQFAVARSNGSSGTVTTESVQAADTVTVNGLVYTAVNGAKADNTEFDMSGTDEETAADLADSVNNDTRAGTLGDVAAVADSIDVNFFQVVITDASGTVTMAAAQAADTVTVNGLVYTAVSGTKADNTEFDISGTNAEAATDLADSINNDTRQGTAGDVTAEADAAVVTMTQTDDTIGDETTLVSSNGTRLAVSGSGTFTWNADATTLASSNGTRLFVSGSTFSGAGPTSVMFVRDIQGVLEEFEPVQKTPKPTAVTAGRALNFEIARDSEYTFTARGLKACMNHIQKIENSYEAQGGDASADTATDFSATDVTVRGATPSESFVFNIDKTGNAYVITPTANS